MFKVHILFFVQGFSANHYLEMAIAYILEKILLHMYCRSDIMWEMVTQPMLNCKLMYQLFIYILLCVTINILNTF